MRKFLAAVITAVLAVGLTANLGSASQGGDYLSDIRLGSDEWLVLAAEQSRDGIHSQLSLQPGSVGVGGTRGEWVQCTDALDPVCSTDSARESIIGSSMLPACSATSASVCIESVKFAASGSALAEANYSREVEQRQDFPGNRELNLLDGRGVPLFTFDQTGVASETSDFGVMVRVTQFWNKSSKRFEPFSFEAEVMPYVKVGPQETTGACLFRVDNSCAKQNNFLPGSRVELTFRMPKQLGGWFSGRMKDPTIAVSEFDAETNRIVVGSEAVEVAALGLVKSRSSFTPIEEMWVQNNGRWFTNGGTATGANSWQENIFPFIENYRPQAKDTAIGTNLVWKMRSISAGSGSGCLNDTSRVLGIVTTNALGYDIGSPAFSDGYLEYKVAGLHYMPNGKDLVLGTYDLVMRSETARCLYGFTNAPVSATVTVVGTGDQTVASTVVSERNGWLKLAAYGFTFSEKEIQVKISQPQTQFITKFSGKTKSLGVIQRLDLDGFAAKSVNNKSFECTVFHFGKSSAALAKSRAKSGCDYLRKQFPQAQFKTTVKQTSSKSWDGRFSVSSR